MKHKVTKEQKLDNLYVFITLLVLIIFMLLCVIFNIKIVSTFIFFLSPLCMYSLALRERKRFKKIGQLKDSLHIPIEKMREISGAGRYDLIEWEKSKATVSRKQMYVLEEYLDNQYVMTFGEKFVLTTN